ncbi:formimidoylglutamate deiminase [Rhodoferax aquaticus]|uniref:Formimidoylglutamate deiminase n=1 Tax=Rhodoferax aquaticus TaxID=2527691 RepID=A0A515EPK2_9BURK|nr:formimidoylglutamate deiminase [Rhodoferax aquaticus]QDL54592.1 formimidoylglutamate deiminase [Rhodoferax aquaticus]
MPLDSTPQTAAVHTFYAPQAWVGGAWAQQVLLRVDAQGHWCEITPNAQAEQGATVLPGPVLPGVVNAHSHAFQRAIAGLTERKSTGAAHASDDFWSWRDRMYSAALRISPTQLEHIATQLYTELLAAGYTQVCEFHYLHNPVDASAIAQPLDMSLALVRAAQKVGLGLTLLPTLYMRSGFGAQGLRADQRRFASTPDSLLRLVQDLQVHTQEMPLVNVGVALHSLRAASPDAIQEVAAHAAQEALPVHIHIAEQTQEVQDCLAHTGQRPIEWLLNHHALNSRWNLVHATHTTQAELQGVAASGASIVICPSTEANLGDGVFDYLGYTQAQGTWSIGSDSHVTRSWSEELRLLEYSQRLTQRKRNVAAQAAPADCLSTAGALFDAALGGGTGASGQALAGIALGQRADFQVLDSHAPSLLGVPVDYVLDATLFSSPDTRPAAVYVAGKLAVNQSTDTADHYLAAMRALWV